MGSTKTSADKSAGKITIGWSEENRTSGGRGRDDGGGKGSWGRSESEDEEGC